MKAMKTFAALLALAFSLAGCGAVDGDPVRPAPGSAGQSSSTAASGADSAEPEQLAALRQLAGEMTAMLVGAAAVFAIRCLSAHYRWNLPHPNA